MSEWRDIKTVPEQQWVVVYKPGWQFAPVAKYEPVEQSLEEDDTWYWRWTFLDESLCLGIDEGQLGFDEDIEERNMPTHWMPVIEQSND